MQQPPLSTTRPQPCPRRFRKNVGDAQEKADRRRLLKKDKTGADVRLKVSCGRRKLLRVSVPVVGGSPARPQHRQQVWPTGACPPLQVRIDPATFSLEQLQQQIGWPSKAK